jgi:hypothetical protein
MDRRAFTEEDEYEEDLDDIDFGNYKGIFYEDDPTTKYQDPETGAHFDYGDICGRMIEIKNNRERYGAHDRDGPGHAKCIIKFNELHDSDREDNINVDEYEADVASDKNYDKNQQQVNEGLTFKNKFNDGEGDHAEALFSRKAQDSKARNPLHFMHQVHQTEEDQENPELLDDDIRINNFFKLNDENKADLLQALHEYSGVKNPSKAHHKNISKFVK